MKKNKYAHLFSAANISMLANGGKWKLDDNGNIEVKDGHPVLIGVNGQEMTVKPSTVPNLQAEAQVHRQEVDALKKQLAAFEGLDADQAREAIAKLGDVDLSKMVDSGKLDEVRNQLTQTYEGKLNEANSKLEEANNRYNSKLLESAFNSSTFIKDKLLIPADMLQHSIANRFKIENDKLVPHDANGNLVYSEKSPGNVADFDEAVEIIINSRKDRDALLKAPAGGGSGASGGGAGAGGGRTMSRAKYEGLSADEKAAVGQQMAQGKIQLV